MQDNVQSIADANKRNLDGMKSRRDSIDPKDDSRLKKYIDRIMKLKEEVAGINSDIKSVYDEADKMGYDRNAIKYIVKIKFKELSDEFKQTVNQFCLDLGEATVFRQTLN